MKFSAFIMCRFNSSRLKGKHFKKIGDKYLISHTIECLNKLSFVNEIYIASGKKEENIIFKKNLSKLYPNIKFYFHRNDHKVLERIYYLSKRIKNQNLLTISGDCPIIDESFLNKSYLKFKKKKVDFLISKKKLQHEGIFFSRKKIWREANLKCKDKEKYQEHFSLFFKKNYKEYNFTFFPYNRIDLHQGLRMSVDTQSDLDFFKIVYLACQKKKIEFNYRNIIHYKKYKILNNHVNQKQEDFKILKKIFILTCKNKNIGLGHYKRSQVIKREIIERMSIIPKIILINNKKNLSKIKRKITQLKLDKKNIFVFDIPKDYFKYFKSINTYNTNFFIDIFQKSKKDISIIPSIRNSKKYLYQGKKYLLINREILFHYFKSKLEKKINYDFIFLMGGTFKISNKILNDVKKLCETFKVALIFGPYVNKGKIKILSELKNFDLFVNPQNYFELIFSSSNVISRFGNTVNEIISMNKKPWIYSFKDTINRKKDINYLIKHNLAHKYEYDDLFKIKKKSENIKQKNMVFGGKNVISLISRIYKK